MCPLNSFPRQAGVSLSTVLLSTMYSEPVLKQPLLPRVQACNYNKKGCHYPVSCRLCWMTVSDNPDFLRYLSEVYSFWLDLGCQPRTVGLTVSRQRLPDGKTNQSCVFFTTRCYQTPCEMLQPLNTSFSKEIVNYSHFCFPFAASLIRNAQQCCSHECQL